MAAASSGNMSEAVDLNHSTRTRSSTVWGYFNRKGSDSVVCRLCKVEMAYHKKKLNSTFPCIINIVAALHILKEKFGVVSYRCAGHTLQLVVNHALKDPKIDKALSAARGLVKHIRKSEPASTKLKQKQKQMGTAEHKLIQDVAVRWNSSYYMIERLLEQRWPVVATLSDPKVTQCGKQYLDLKSDQWILLDELKEVLKPYEQATNVLSLLKSTQNKSFDSATVNSFQNCEEEEILYRWQPEVSAFQADGKNVSLIAAALDPRFRKLKFLSPEDALKLQVTVQREALDLKREQRSQLQQEDVGQEASASPPTKKRSVLDTLLGTDSEEEDCNENTDQGGGDTGAVPRSPARAKKTPICL
ncbi:desumoylating isopeptidase 1 [Sarotherodon galilaeus]